MSNLFFSPSGRIGSQDFMKAGVILIAIGAGLSVLKIISPATGLIAGIASLVLLFPWICIWLKRLHNGNKSGEMIVGYIALYAALLIVLTLESLH